MLGVRDSSKTYENKVVSHRVVPESDLNVRQSVTITMYYMRTLDKQASDSKN